VSERVVVIGGGISGTVSSLRLARAGREVILLERSPNLGGLVVSFSVGGTPLECFYHHVFPSEREMIRLVNELGLGPRFGWFRSTVGVLTHGRVWPFTSAGDLLRFEPLPFVDRLRTGLGAARLTGADWRRFDRIQAREWLRIATGDRATEVIWDPLLRFKFGDAGPLVPASWMAARFRQRASARTLRGERLGYLRGGFRQLFDALALSLEQLGADVRTGTAVRSIEVEDGSVSAVTLEDGSAIETGAVLYAGQLPGLARLLPEAHTDRRLRDLEGLGAVCIVVELTDPITNFYWTNICTDQVPFGALIEHTNLVPAGDYGGRHIAYLGYYFTKNDPVATADVDEFARDWISALEDSLPSFSSRSVVDVHPFRTPYAAPLITLGYRHRMLPVRTPVRGLFAATTAQIYPEDRGMNEGIRLADRAAEEILSFRHAPRRARVGAG
jgi:protoporphyrinogen oxidase